mmetsp:Transcript_14984/g.50536  ORF Transcript_14984/g.50536 Transcript_14984/m.50536 type:complete len:558 (+) Transcript_14984:52-1725(+)
MISQLGWHALTLTPEAGHRQLLEGALMQDGQHAAEEADAAKLHGAHRQGQLHRKGHADPEVDAKHEPLLPRIVRVVPGEAGPAREEARPLLIGEVEKAREEAAEPRDGLPHEILTAKHAEVALQAVLERQQGCVRCRSRALRGEGLGSGNVQLRCDGLGDRQRGCQHAAHHVARSRVHRPGGRADGHHALVGGGQRAAHGDVAELLLLHGPHFDAQVLEAQLQARLALVKVHRGPRHERRLLEEDLPAAALRLAEGHGVQEGRLILHGLSRYRARGAKFARGGDRRGGHPVRAVVHKEHGVLFERVGVHVAHGPVGDLEAGVVLARLGGEARHAVARVHNHLGAHLRAVHAAHRGGGGPVGHRRGLGAVHARPEEAHLGLLQARHGAVLELLAVHPGVRLCDARACPRGGARVALPAKVALREGPRVAQALVEAKAKLLLKRLPLMHPHAIVVGPRVVQLGIHECNLGVELLRHLPCQHGTSRAGSHDQDIRVDGLRLLHVHHAGPNRSAKARCLRRALHDANDIANKKRGNYRHRRAPGSFCLTRGLGVGRRGQAA